MVSSASFRKYLGSFTLGDTHFDVAGEHQDGEDALLYRRYGGAAEASNQAFWGGQEGDLQQLRTCETRVTSIETSCATDRDGQPHYRYGIVPAEGR
jgi:hypothetical protein